MWSWVFGCWVSQKSYVDQRRRWLRSFHTWLIFLRRWGGMFISLQCCFCSQFFNSWLFYCAKKIISAVDLDFVLTKAVGYNVLYSVLATGYHCHFCLCFHNWIAVVFFYCLRSDLLLASIVLLVVVCHHLSSVTLLGRPAGGFTHAGQAMTSCRLQSNYSSVVTLHGGPVVLRPVRTTRC